MSVSKQILHPLKVCVVLAAVVLFAGCAALGLGGKHYGAINFYSEPPGAEVINLRDDTNLGTTPIAVWWESSDGKPVHVTVEFRKHGYHEKITSFWVNTRHDSIDEAIDNAKPIKVQLSKRK